MRCASLATVLLAGCATTAHALWYAIASGTQGYAFLPATQHAIVGDAIHFEIPNNTLADPPISVVQSKSLAEPCTPMPGGLHSDDQNPPKLDINVYSATAPVYFHAEPYCSQGMVFILNPLEDGDYDTFVKNALATAPTSDATSASPRPSSSSSGPESASTLSRTEEHSGDISSSSETSVAATNSTRGGSTSTDTRADGLGATPAPTAHVGSVGTLVAAIACSIAGTLCLSAIFVFGMRKCRCKAAARRYGEIDPEPAGGDREGPNPSTALAVEPLSLARHTYSGTGSGVLTASTTPAASSTSTGRSSMAERQLGAVQEMLQRGVSGTAVLEALRMQSGSGAEAPPRYM